MTDYTILNDTHIGAIRTAGTTVRSAAALNEWMHEKFEELLVGTVTDLIILGDLFDKFDVPMKDSLRAYYALVTWLKGTGRNLHLVAGNHDLSKDSTRLGAFDFVSRILESQFPSQVSVWKAPGHIDDEVYVIPHLANQDLFDLAMSKVPADVKFVLLHANYDNNFAVESDHSLNVSREQARSLPGTVVFAHVHYHDEDMKGKIQIIGNQIPSSVSDHLGAAETKYYAQILDGEYVIVPVPDQGTFARIGWRDLGSPALEGGPQFVRVEGECSAQESASAVSAIDKYRKGSNAFVITNAVKVEGLAELGDVAEDLDTAKSFDVVEAVLELLTKKEAAKLRELIEANNHD